jgi:hypothetical protein
MTNQTNVRLDAVRQARLERAVKRFRKERAADVFRELFDLYMDHYERIEEARLRAIEEQENALQELHKVQITNHASE